MGFSAERDSTKDEAVVFIFIFATTGLLIWAGIKPWVEKGMQVRVQFLEKEGGAEQNGALTLSFTPVGEGAALIHPSVWARR